MKTTISIDGMSCQHCVHAVRKALSDLDGVEIGDVVIGSATIDYSPDQIDIGQIEEAISAEGYQVVSST